MTTIRALQQLYLPVIAPEDFFILLAHATGKDTVFLLAHPEYELSDASTTLAIRSLTRRQRHEPVAYITGHKEFYGRDFFVGPGVLIPRPETELIVEQVIRHITTSTRSRKKIAVIDVGTGSGAIIISLALSLPTHHHKNISWIALESEECALRYARKNAKHLCVNKTIRFLKSDLLSRILPELFGYDEVIIVANLPYLSATLYRKTAPNVKHYEPKSALVSGTDGLDHYRRLLHALVPIASSLPASTLFLEISPEQKKALVQEISLSFPDSSTQVYPDLSGRDRCLELTLS